MERLGERLRELDVPLLAGWPDGRRKGIQFVVEEESEAGRFSIHRLAHCCLDLAERLGTDRIVPVVVFLRSDQRPATLRLGGDRHCDLDCRYRASESNRQRAEEDMDSDKLVVRLNLPDMD